jgi:hypothetical protein
MWGMTTSRLNRDSLLEDYKEGYDIYSKKAKRYFPQRHKDKDSWELAHYCLQQANFYKHMIRQVQELGELQEEF